MKDKNILIIEDEKGKEKKHKILFTFNSSETKNDYIIYTDETSDKEGNINVYASIYKEKDGIKLSDIKTKKEWDIVENILSTITKQNKEE